MMGTMIMRNNVAGKTNDLREIGGWGNNGHCQVTV
jgi:hypothetical protein